MTLQEERERVLQDQLQAAEEGQRLAERALELKERWHESDLAERKKKRDAAIEQAKRDRAAMAKREKAVQAAQVALNSQEVRHARLVGNRPICPLSNSRLHRRAPTENR